MYGDPALLHRAEQPNVGICLLCFLGRLAIRLRGSYGIRSVNQAVRVHPHDVLNSLGRRRRARGEIMHIGAQRPKGKKAGI